MPCDTHGGEIFRDLTAPDTMHKPVRYHFKISRVFAEGTDYQWQADLADLGSVQKYDDGFRYLLTCIDVFSKYACSIPLKDKTGPSLVSAFKTKLSSNGKPCGTPKG